VSAGGNSNAVVTLEMKIRPTEQPRTNAQILLFFEEFQLEEEEEEEASAYFLSRWIVSFE